MRVFGKICIIAYLAIAPLARAGDQAIKIDTATGKVEIPLGGKIDFTTPGLTIIGIPVVPTGTGFPHITSGVQDAAAHLVLNADVDVAAAIVQSKLNLNGTIPGAWLGATGSTAAAGNDSRLSDQRTPTDGSVTDAKVAGGAAIVQSKLNLNGTIPAAWLGATASTAAAGNDSRLSDTRTPTDGSVTDAKVAGGAAIVQSKLNLNGTIPGAWLGATASTAAAGNDSRLSDTRTPTDGSVTTAKIVDKAITYAKIQDISATKKLLGRWSAGAGVTQEVAVGSGLDIDGSGNLFSTAGGGNVTGAGLTTGNVITGAGGAAIQDGGVALTSLQAGYQAATVSAAGNTASNQTGDQHSIKITANAGAGTYTATVSLPTTNRVAGDAENFHLTFAASVNPTVEIHNATSGGTLLFTWTGDGIATEIAGRCVYSGSAWVLEDGHFVW